MTYIDISLLMSFLLHSSLLMTLLDKIYTCNAFPNAFPILNHTDHKKIKNCNQKEQIPIKVPTRLSKPEIDAKNVVSKVEDSVCTKPDSNKLRRHIMTVILQFPRDGLCQWCLTH